jgi:peptidoglycan-associated lipoprotein
MMRKRLMIGVGILALLMAGCSKQPELDINAEQNLTSNNSSKTQTDDSNQKLTESDLTDTTVVKVTDDSMNLENEDQLNEKLASSLSKDVVYFNFDKYNIRADQMGVVENVASLLKDANTNFTVRIEGNCDEWGTDEYNYALGLKRAKSVKTALSDLGVDSNRLTIISYGETNPVCTSHTKSCWAKNRRDNFTLLP